MDTSTTSPTSYRTDDVSTAPPLIIRAARAVRRGVTDAWVAPPWFSPRRGFRWYDVGLGVIVGMYFVTFLRVNRSAGMMLCLYALLIFFWWRHIDSKNMRAYAGETSLLRRSRIARLIEIGTVIATILIVDPMAVESAQVVAFVGWAVVTFGYFRARHRYLETVDSPSLTVFQRSANIASFAIVVWLIVVATGSTEWHYIFQFMRNTEALGR